MTTDQYPNEALLRNGYIGCSPLFPNVAISLRTLSAYRQIHRTSPRFSFEAMCKTLCHLHNVRIPKIIYYYCCQTERSYQVPYRSYLRNQLVTSFDAYLDICRRVDQQLNEALGYDSSGRLSRACPACFKRVPGEPELDFSVLVSIDGNNSLKRIGTKIRGSEELQDLRSIKSERWLAPEEVDVFKNEVPNLVRLYHIIIILGLLNRISQMLTILLMKLRRQHRNLNLMPMKISIASIGGKTQGLKRVSECLGSLMKQASSLPVAGIAWYFMHAT